MNKVIFSLLFFTLGQVFGVSYAADGNFAKKAELSKQFKSFISENQKLRSDHEKKVYDLQKQFLEENYKKQQDLLSKLSALENKLEFGEREKNKEIRAEIKKTFKTFRGEMRERRKSFFKETLKGEKKTFREQMKERHKTLKGELKAEIGPLPKDHKGKGKRGDRMKERKQRRDKERSGDDAHEGDDSFEDE